MEAPTRMIHLRNGRAERHGRTFGEGATWCGKKLLGTAETTDDGLDAFTSYGSRVVVTFDPATATCRACRDAFAVVYNAAFPEGPKPIATFRSDDPDSIARLASVMSPDALNKTLGPGGGGVEALTEALRAASDPMPGAV